MHQYKVKGLLHEMSSFGLTRKQVLTYVEERLKRENVVLDLYYNKSEDKWAVASFESDTPPGYEPVGSYILVNDEIEYEPR